MKQIIFKLYDNKANTVIALSCGRTYTDIVRKNLGWISSQFPLRDVDIIDTGYRIDMDTGVIDIDDKEKEKKIEWSCYEFPKNRIENCTSVGLKYEEENQSEENGDSEKVGE